MMTRKEAIKLIYSKVPNENLCRHMIAVGAIMKRMAERFGRDPDFWETTGILHDIDLGTTDNPEEHGRMGSEWLEKMGMPSEMIHAILVHAGHAESLSELDVMLVAADQLSGLITACALVKGRKLTNVTPRTISKRYREMRFAAGADRVAIRRCEEVGISLDTFIGESLAAMQTVSEELGL